MTTRELATPVPVDGRLPVASDNRRYAAAGFAAVGIGAGMAGYHSPADTPDRVQSSTMAALARLVVATTLFTVDTLETSS